MPKETTSEEKKKFLRSVPPGREAARIISGRSGRIVYTGRRLGREAAESQVISKYVIDGDPDMKQLRMVSIAWRQKMRKTIVHQVES